MKVNLLLRWTLLQTHRTEAAQLLAVAVRTGTPNTGLWAAQVLQHSKLQSSAIAPLLMGDVIAFAQKVSRGTGTTNARAARKLAHAYSLAGATASGSGSGSALAPTSAAAAKVAPTTAQAGRLSVGKARAAFNNPSHWLETSSGKLVPNAARLQGQSLQAWQSLSTKFGTELSESLFDARVRGASAASVIDVMQSAGSTKTLTIRDLAELMFVAIGDGRSSNFAGPVDTPSLHDGFHTYGTSAFEEMFGDAHTEGLVLTVFGADGEVPLVDLDRGKPLSEQPKAVRQIKAAIKEAQASVPADNIGYEVSATFFKPAAGASGAKVFKHDWARAPEKNAAMADSILNGNGLLSHLTVNDRQGVSRLLYDTGNPKSLASISKDFQRTKDRNALASSLGGWTQTLAAQVAAAGKPQMMSTRRFNEHAAQALAMGLLLERTSAGVLRKGPVDTSLSNTDLPLSVRQLDLRKSYPAALREVRSALGLKP